MKEFLFNKFLGRRGDTAKAFYLDTMDSLPSPENKEFFTIWGFDQGGVWWASKEEAHYYESDGTINIISLSKDKTFFDLSTALYNSSVSQGLSIISQPIDFDDSLVIPSEESEKVYYLKFKTPNGSYGIPTRLMLLDDTPTKDNLMQHIKDKITTLTWIFTELKKLNPAKYPERFHSETWLKTDKGIMITVLPDFNLTPQDCLTLNIEPLVLGVGKLPDSYTELGTELINNAREAWTKILIN